MVKEFKHLGILTNQNCMHKQINTTLNSRNAWYHLEQSLLPCFLISKNIKIKLYRNTILHVVLYGCETWSLTLWDEHTLRVFDKRVLRKTLGPTGDEKTGEWKRVHNKGLYNLYSSLNIWVIKSRRIRLVRHVAHTGKRRGAYRILVGKPEGKIPLGKATHRWENNIKMNLQAMR
jgi:hypothetical protein